MLYFAKLLGKGGRREVWVGERAVVVVFIWERLGARSIQGGGLLSEKIL